MSGVLKSATKIFKKVVQSTPFKIAATALAVGAVVFTGGAALGVLPTWGAAMGSLTGALGLGSSSVLGGVLTGALTQAGYGAALGGGLSALTGGDPMKGAAYGAAAGAATGGVTGGLGFNTDPLSGLNGPPSEAASNGMLQGGDKAASLIGESAQDIGPLSQAVPPGGAETSLNFNPPPTPPAVSAAPTDNGLLSAINRNPGLATIAGSAVAGLGQGLLKDAEADTAGKAAIERDRAERAAISGNYATSGGGLLSRSTVQTGPYPTPADRFDPRTYAGRYVYNPQTGRVEFVPNQVS